MNDDEAFDIKLPPDPTEEALAQLVQLQQQSQQQIQMAMQQIGQMQQQLAQAITQALGQVAQSNQMVAAAVSALSAPRRRIPVRDAEGRITEAHDVPMSMQ